MRGGKSTPRISTEKHTIISPVRTAERSSKAMEIETENIVPATATPTAERLIRYQTLLALLDTLYGDGEINKETYTIAGKLMAMKCGLKQDSIFIESGLDISSEQSDI